MKGTAVLIYDQFCNFEISVVLEMLAMAGKPITIFAKEKRPIKSEEGLTVLPDKTIDELCLDEFDSLVLPGAADIRKAIEDEAILEFIRRFDSPAIKIGAISIAPILLLKTGMLKGKAFMAGVNKEDLYEEGFTESDLAGMVGWDDSLRVPVAKGYIVAGNIVTAVSYNFLPWSLAFGDMIGLHIPPETFGLRTK